MTKNKQLLELAAKLSPDLKPNIKPKIIINMIECGYCNQVLLSLRRHDYRTCECGKTSVDGGKDYLKRSGDCYIEKSIWLVDGKLRSEPDPKPSFTMSPKMHNAIKKVKEEIDNMSPEDLRKLIDETESIFDPGLFINEPREEECQDKNKYLEELAFRIPQDTNEELGINFIYPDFANKDEETP